MANEIDATIVSQAGVLATTAQAPQVQVTIGGQPQITASMQGFGPQGPQGVASTVPGPQGEVGATGPANTLSIGTVTEGTTSATITGTSPNQILNLTLQKGNTGSQGIQGEASTVPGPAGTNGVGVTPQAIGFTLTGGTTPKTLTVALDGSVSGTNTGDQDLSGKLDKNIAITGATKTKITYDAKGLVTVGSDATTADIAASTNKNYVTDAQATVIGNMSGTNTGDVTLVAGSNTLITTSAGTSTISSTVSGGGANGRIYYPQNSVASSLTGYKVASTTPSANATSNVSIVCPTQNAYVLGEEFATLAGEPNTTSLPAGTAIRFLFASTSSGTAQILVNLFQYKTTGNIATTGAVSFTYVNGGVLADSITRLAGSFVSEGFTAGCKITVAGTASNNGTYTVQTVVALTITLILSDVLTAEVVSSTITTKEKLLRSGSSGEFMNTTAQLEQFFYTDSSAYTLAIDDRIVFKWWGRKTNAGASATITIGTEGLTTASYIQTTLPVSLGLAQGTSLQLSGLTASEILSTDANKNLTSLAVATYPSLTEISHVKGVTSALQTQINSKQATLVSTTNIKTVNGTTLLGSGDLVVSGGGGIDNLLPNSNFINNSTNGYGSTPDDWTSSSANPVQGGFPAMTKQNHIDLLGIADADIEGLWNLNEASGNATDLSSNAYHLTDTNTVTNDADGLMSGGARKFTAANSEYFTISNAASTNLNLTGSQTWFCFFKPTATDISGGARIMSKGVNERELILDTTTIYFQHNGSTVTNVGSSVRPQADKWHFVVWTYNGTNTTIWVNGTKTTIAATGTLTANTNAFEIGRPSGTNSNYFNGIMANAGVLSVALTDLQVKRLFAATMYRGQKIRRATTNALLTATLTEDKVERLRGKTVTMSAKMWQEVASTGQISINTDSSTTTTTIGQWVDVSVTSIVSATATKIDLSLKGSTSDGNVWFKEAMLNVGSTALPWTAAPEDWVRFPRLLRMDIPEVINGYHFEENRWFDFIAVPSTGSGFSGGTTNGKMLIRGNSAKIMTTIDGRTQTGTTGTVGYYYPVVARGNVPQYFGYCRWYVGTVGSIRLCVIDQNSNIIYPFSDNGDSGVTWTNSIFYFDAQIEIPIA